MNSNKSELPVGVKLSLKNNTIKFEEDPYTGYSNRTKINASADATIALAFGLTKSMLNKSKQELYAMRTKNPKDKTIPSAGEKLTYDSVIKQGKKYIPLDAASLEVTDERVNKIVEGLNSVNAKTLNIAGNGIYTMKNKYTQQQIDEFTYQLLKAVIENPNLKNKIISIRSGGQTGFDEAGAKAGIRLGIPTSILAPKGWKFRNESGQDISNEKLFKERFESLNTLDSQNTSTENVQQGQQPKVRNIESYMEERINLINEIMNSNKSELPVEVLSEMSMDQLRNILKC